MAETLPVAGKFVPGGAGIFVADQDGVQVGDGALADLAALVAGGALIRNEHLGTAGGSPSEQLVDGIEIENSASAGYVLRVGASASFTPGDALHAARPGSGITVDGVAFYSKAGADAGKLYARPGSSDNKAVSIWLVRDIPAIRAAINAVAGSGEFPSAELLGTELEPDDKIRVLDKSAGTEKFIEPADLIQFFTAFWSLSSSEVVDSADVSSSALWTPGEVFVAAVAAIADSRQGPVIGDQAFSHPPTDLSDAEKAAARAAIGAPSALANPVATRAETLEISDLPAGTVGSVPGIRPPFPNSDIEVISGEGSPELVSFVSGDNHFTLQAGSYLVSYRVMLERTAAGGEWDILLVDGSDNHFARDRTTFENAAAVIRHGTMFLNVPARANFTCRTSYENGSHSGSTIKQTEFYLTFIRLGIGEIDRQHFAESAIKVTDEVRFFSGPDAGYHISDSAQSASSPYDIGNAGSPGAWASASGSLDSIGYVDADGNESLLGTVGNIEADCLYEVDLYQTHQAERHFAASILTGRKLVEGLGVLTGGSTIREGTTRLHDQAATVQGTPIPVPYQGGGSDVYFFRMKENASDADSPDDRLFAVSDSGDVVVLIRKIVFHAEVKLADGSVGADALADGAVAEPKLSPELQEAIDTAQQIDSEYSLTRLGVEPGPLDRNYEVYKTARKRTPAQLAGTTNTLDDVDPSYWHVHYFSVITAATEYIYLRVPTGSHNDIHEKIGGLIAFHHQSGTLFDARAIRASDIDPDPRHFLTDTALLTKLGTAGGFDYYEMEVDGLGGHLRTDITTWFGTFYERADIDPDVAAALQDLKEKTSPITVDSNTGWNDVGDDALGGWVVRGGSDAETLDNAAGKAYATGEITDRALFVRIPTGSRSRSQFRLFGTGTDTNSFFPDQTHGVNWVFGSSPLGSPLLHETTSLGSRGGWDYWAIQFGAQAANISVELQHVETEMRYTWHGQVERARAPVSIARCAILPTANHAANVGVADATLTWVAEDGVNPADYGVVVRPAQSQSQDPNENNDHKLFLRGDMGGSRNSGRLPTLLFEVVTGPGSTVVARAAAMWGWHTDDSKKIPLKWRKADGTLRELKIDLVNARAWNHRATAERIEGYDIHVLGGGTTLDAGTFVRLALA